MTYGHQLMKIGFVLFLAVVSRACRCHSSSAGSTTDDPPPSRPSPPSQHRLQPPPLATERIDAIKTEILTKLGMKNAPDLERTNARNETERRRILEIYEETHRQLSSKTHDAARRSSEQHAKQFYVFTAERNSVKVIKRKKEAVGVHIFFDVNIRHSTDEDKQIKVTEATLQLFKNRKYIRSLKGEEQKVRVKIYQIISLQTNKFDDETERLSHPFNATKRRTDARRLSAQNITTDDTSRKSLRYTKRRKERRFGRRLIESRIVSLNSSSFVEEFHLLKSVAEWISDASTNHGLLVTMESKNHRLPDVFRLKSSRRRRRRTSRSRGRKTDARMPKLSVFVREEVNSVRRKRSVDGPRDCRAGDGEGRCCRFSMWISFADIGWSDWIVAPDGFMARYCDGSCPSHYKTANRFSSIKELLRSRRRPAEAAASPPPPPPPTCCSATRMSSLPIAHYNHEKVAVISVFEDMIVEDCKCS